MKEIPYEKSLEYCNPELAKEWHPTKNGALTPKDVTAKSGRKVWWIYPYDDPDTGKHFDFEWEVAVYKRSGGNECPFLSGKKVWAGYNDLETINPELAKEWHPTKNGALTPKDVTANSYKKVWWYLPYDDPISGKHFDFEWEANIGDRSNGDRCPFLANRKVWIGYNDLETINPDLAKEWHPSKNGSLTPKDVTESSEKKVWWFLPYDDPISGKHFDFEWEASIHNRSAGRGCPFLSGKKVLVGYNDLETINPDLAKEWHPTKNGALTPKDVTANSRKKVWWFLPYDDPISGKHFDFEWEAVVFHRSAGRGCPFLVGKKVLVGYNDLETLFPEIAEEFDYQKNRKLVPSKIYAYTHRKVWWKCINGHSWRQEVYLRTRRGMSCTDCRKEI